MKLEVRHVGDNLVEITVDNHDTITQEVFDKNEASEFAIELLGVVKELIEFSKQNY